MLTIDKRPLVYLAGPYTNPDPVVNVNRTVQVAEEIIARGRGTPIIPHLSLVWHLVSPHDIDFWYAYDLAILARCDCLLRLPGASAGAEREVAFARERRIPVFFDLDAAGL